MKLNSFRLIAILIVCAMLTAGIMVFTVGAEEADSLYVTAINEKVTGGSGTVFTFGFNNSDTIKSDPNADGGGNFVWATVITCEPTDTAGVYKMTSIQSNLANDVTVTIPEGGFLYAAHVDDTEEAKESGLHERSSKNVDKLKELTVGQLLTISGINLTAETITEDAEIIIGEANVEQPSEDESIPEESEEESEPVESLDDESEPEESPTDETTPDESVVSENSPADEDEDDGFPTAVLIAIIAAGVLAIAVISYVIAKKRKK